VRCTSEGRARRLFLTVGIGSADNGVLSVSFSASTDTTVGEFSGFPPVFGRALMDAHLSRKDIARQVATEAQLALREESASSSPRTTRRSSSAASPAGGAEARGIAMQARGQQPPRPTQPR
jgi:hypothetical protein